MPAAKWGLIQFRDDWWIGQLDTAGSQLKAAELGSTHDDMAAHLAQQLDVAGYHGEGLLLGVASRSCLSARVPLDQSRSVDRTTATYALEAWLPLSAEDIVGDFIIQGREALGVAVRTQDQLELLQALERRGICVYTICPTSLLALQNYLPAENADDAQVVVWGNDQELELFVLHDGRPVQWQLLSADPDVLGRHLEVTAAEYAHVLRLWAIDLPERILNSVSQLESVRLEQTVSCRLIDQAVAMANQIMNSKRQPWIQLARSALAPPDPHWAIRRELRIAHASLLIFVAALAVALIWRAGRYEGRAEQLQAEQVRVFRDVLPDQRVPLGIRSRMESELTRLAEQTAASGSLNAPSAFALLHRVLASLPEEGKYHIAEARFDGEEVYLEGRVPRHADADAMALALRQDGFDVELPQTEQRNEQGVKLELSARITSSSSRGN